MGYRKISKELNRHNIKSPQGKTFYPSLVQSIWKKIVKREKVMSKPVVSEYRDFDIGFVQEEKLIVQQIKQWSMAKMPQAIFA